MNAKLPFGQFSVRGYVNYDKHVAKYLKILPDQFSYQAIEDVVKADAEKILPIMRWEWKIISIMSRSRRI